MTVFNNWQFVPLKDVCYTNAGGTPLKSVKEYYENGNIPWILSGEVNCKDIISCKQFITQKGLDNSSAKIYPVNSILVTMYGATAGQIGILRFEAASNQAVCAIHPNNEILPEFLYYFLLDEKKRLLAKAVGNAQPNISQEKIKNTIIPLPPIAKQKEIVEKLDTAFQAIDAAKANLEKNIENAKELFQSKLNEVFSQKGEDWEEKRLGEVIIKTKNINPKDFEQREYKYVDVSAVNRNSLKIENYILINAENAPSRARKQVLEDDVIFATVRPTLKRVTIISSEFNYEICSTGYVVLRANSSKILSHLIFYYLQTDYFMECMEKLQKGASYPAVTDNEVKDQLIRYSKSFVEQQKIVSQLDQLSAQTDMLIQKYQQKLQNLEELRKSVLERAFGE